MKYNQLNLKQLCKDAGIDFAHYTFLPGMCSCCHGPLDFPTRYWVNGKKGYEAAVESDKYSYIIFKNSYNFNGVAKGADEIKDKTMIMWNLKTKKQLKAVCKALRAQLGSEYIVIEPKTEALCIEIHKRKTK